VSVADVPPPPELDETFDCWRLVVAEKVCSLAELRRSWYIEDVADACDMLRYMAAQQRAATGAKQQPAQVTESEVAALAGVRAGQVRQRRRRR
jgi:hypothetical protein